MSDARTDQVPDFLGLSEALTGFTVFRLQGTGMTDAYLTAICEALGDQTLAELLSAYRHAVAGGDTASLEARLRAGILSHEKLGPVARNVIKLWYLGTWNQMPDSWRAAFGASANDTTFVVSPAAYTEGLLWPAVDGNPPGAKGPGWGTWTQPPRIPEI